MGFWPTAGNSSNLHICLGWVNLSCNLTGAGGSGSGNLCDVDTTKGFSFDPSDVGSIIMVAGAGPGGAPLWTTIASYTAANAAVLTDSGGPVLTLQAVIYREINVSTVNGDGHVLSGSIRSRSSLTTMASLNFAIRSCDGSLAPQAGQPVLAYMLSGALPAVYAAGTTYAAGAPVSYYGQIFLSLQGSNTGNTPVSGESTAWWSSQDVFGGKIAQAKSINYPGLAEIQTQCQCVSWDVLLTDAVLSMRSSAQSATVQGFTGDGTTTSWDLTYIPVTVTSIQEVSTSSVTTSTTGGVTTVKWASGYDFSDLGAGDTVIISGIPYVVNAIVNNQTLTLTTVAPTFVTGQPAGMQGPSQMAGIVDTETTHTDLRGTFSNYVHVIAGCSFGALSVGSTLYINRTVYTVATVVSDVEVTLTTNPGNQSGVGWVSDNPREVPWGVAGTSGAEYTWAPGTSKITQSGLPFLPMAPGRTLLVSYTYVGASQFTNTTAGAIVTAICAAIANDNVSVDAAAGPAVTSLAFDVSQTVEQCLSKLCQYVSLGTTIYWYWIDARIVLHFELQGVTSAAPWNISSALMDPLGGPSNANVLIEVSNTQTMEKMVNAAAVSTSNILGSQILTQVFACDGTKRTFNTDFPIGQLLTMSYTDIFGTFYPPFGVLNAGTVTDGFYWAPNSTAITEDISGNTLTACSLTVTYLPIVSSLLTYYNTAAIAARQAIEGGSGEHDSYTTSSGTLPILTSGITLAQIIAEYFAAVSQAINVVTYRSGLQTGQSITVDLPGIAASGSYVIDSVSMTDVGNVLKWTVSILAGAAIGDWRTAFKNLTGAGGNSITALGGAGVTGAAAATNITTQYVTVAGSSPAAITPNTAAADGAMLVVIILQDATGYAISWSSAFAGVTPTTVPTTPNTRSVLIFAGSTATGLWYLLPSTLGRLM